MFHIFSALVRIMSWLPSRLLVWLSYPLSTLTWFLSRTKRNTTRINLGDCYPDMETGDRERLGRQSMRHYVMLALETGIAWYWNKQRLYSCFDPPEGMELFDEARQSGKGVLLLVPHFGNWELLQLWLSQEIELASLYKPGRYPEFEEKLLRKRRRFGGELAPTSRAGIKVLVQFLKSSRCTLILPDQDPSEGQGRFIPFFGIPAYTPVLASRICKQTGCRALMATCSRRPGGRYRVHFAALDENFYSDDLEASLVAMNKGVEEIIAIDPQQYLWAYKRFKTRPEGEPPFYRR